MKSIAFAPCAKLILLAALLNVIGAIPRSAAGTITDPVLTLAINETNQTAVVSWFGVAGVTYQLETSSDLATWTDAGTALTGTGNILDVTHSIAGMHRVYFRLKRPTDTITAVFNPSTGVLTIIGGALGNTIAVCRDGTGTLLINDGGVPITGGVPTIASTILIEIFGRGGNDYLLLDETNGALPKTNLFGEADNDTLTGGSGPDVLNGGPGLDTLLGKGGADNLFGGDNDDTLTGGDGDDQVFGEGDNDRMIWNPGDDTDLNEGGSGSDTVEVNGGGGAEDFTVTSNGTRVRFDRINPAPFALDIGTSESLVLNANGGNDTLACTGDLASLIQITADGGAGEDTLLGSNGADTLIGGDNNDFIDGQQGIDVAFMGAGDDTFQWDPGDGNDTVEGQDGTDKLLFNGSNGAEIFDVSAVGPRVRFTRNLGNIVMDLDDIETLDLNALGNTDTFTVNDLTGTDLISINTELASTIGGATGDAAADTVIINGTNADDIITATLPGGNLLVTGLAASVLVKHFETGPTIDTIRIQGLAGDDIVDASAVGAGSPVFVLDGGSGNDILLGGTGADNLIGGENDDVLLGNLGVDVLDGGTGDNTLIQDGINVTSGIVSIFGDALDNAITISRDAGGALFSNGVAIPGATVANTALIRVFGQGGNDTITFNETNGPLPAAMLFGGAGIDSMTGGVGADFLFGGADNDTLLGKNGFDLLFGGAGGDTLTGGDADDQVFGEADSDRFIWNPGDDTDLNEGGSGNDTVEVNGGGGAEDFTVTSNGTRVRFDRLNPAPFALDIGTSETLLLNANGGNDTLSCTGDLASLIRITADGGAGEDTLLGSNGADTLIGGDNNDFIDGQQGIDMAFMGAGDDTFQWDPGDGNDTVEGQDGNDKLLFNGSNGAEIFDVSAVGSRVRFTRNLGNIVMDLDDIENLELNALGNADTFTINDLSGTDLTGVDAKLAATIGGATGDGAADNVIVNATNGVDTVTVTGAGTGAAVTGLSAVVTITTAEAANDRLTVNALGGNDNVQAPSLPSGVIGLTLNGDIGDDVLIGSAGVDQLNGQDDNDSIDGNEGADIVVLGIGDDTFQWNPGDGNDIVEGQAGTDTLHFNGSNSSEDFDAFANGPRLQFFRDVANVLLDCDDVEKVRVNALEGADILVIGELTGTDVNEFIVNLAAAGGGGDAQPDSIFVNGTQGADTIAITGSPGTVTVTGLSATVTLTGGEPANDSLTLNALGGLDNVNATALPAGTARLSVNGGLGDDVLMGSQGGDSFNGGDGNDVVFGAGGDDSLVWNPGDDNDIFEGQAGSDRLIFNGANVAEIFNVSASGSRVSFTRNIASVLMDLDDVEILDLNFLGGADTLTVNDLDGTDLTTINADLAATIGGSTGDGQVDAITVNGTASPDTIYVLANAGAVEVSGLAALVRISHSEAANDDLVVNGLGGVDDIILGSGVTALIGVTANQ